MARVSLGPRPWLRPLRHRCPGFVRRSRCYYGEVRLLRLVHHRLRLLAFPMREMIPVNQTGQPEQLVTLIQDLIETAAVEIAGARQRHLGSHGKTPVLSGSAPRTWHSTMLRQDQESFNLNQLWVVQARLP